MAEKKKKTLRSQREEAKSPKKPRRLTSARTKISDPLRKAAVKGKREIHFIRLPENRFGRLLGKRVNLIPNYFRESWAEIRQVTWPTRKETLNLSLAVFIFAAVLTIIVAILDFGLDKIFKELIIQ